MCNRNSKMKHCRGQNISSSKYTSTKYYSEIEYQIKYQTTVNIKLLISEHNVSTEILKVTINKRVFKKRAHLLKGRELE